ncbi:MULTISPECIES: hypothetical protein [Bacillus amyloliquefaciens group]|nr:hypothetical protein [Bacillus velezensis]PJN84039.1 hypothetical protein CV739_12850 [Bacillus velezensis]QAW50724.1 hypothetical protein ETK69_13755 [Bacillus velezensis]UYV21606.1 hypothetical protein K9864_13905 [Bacillus velezensis]WDV98943.1 hypothetical protein PWA59_14010 [Bacillus velezensis]WMX43311.1 hypothetical protein RGQ10_09755 [Bacillus velezensis]
MILFMGFLTIFSTVGFIVGLIFLVFRKTRKKAYWLVPSTLILAIIGFSFMSKPVEELGEREEQPISSANIEPMDSDAQEDSDEDDSTVVHKLNWSEKKNDTTFKIDRVGIVKNEMESGAEGAIAVHFVIDNRSKKDISTFPNQGTLLTNTKEQIDASLSLSEDIGGEIMSGAKKEGYVLYPIKKLNDPNDIKSIRVKWDFWPDKDVTTNAQDFDINLTW